MLGIHWTSVYRLRKRFLADPVLSSLRPKRPGRATGSRHLEPKQEAIVDDVLTQWLPRQRELPHPRLSVHIEVRRRCGELGIQAPSRATVGRRLAAFHETQANRLANSPDALIAPGALHAAHPLDIVQIDHTQADVFVVDRFDRRTLGRPWLSVAIDVSTRCVLGIYLGMERPNAATVALLISRIVLPKNDWLNSLGADAEWPMHGIPKTLHLDNAAEFRGRALTLGCAEYGIDLDYRPVGRPHYGGHIERLNRTLMQRLQGLPGATGNSPKGRKASRPEAKASLTLPDLERWLALEISQRYHHSEHRGLHGATPASAWLARAESSVRTLGAGAGTALRFLIHFMPVAQAQHPGGRTDALLHSLLAPGLRCVARIPQGCTCPLPPGGLVMRLCVDGWQELRRCKLRRRAQTGDIPVGATCCRQSAARAWRAQDLGATLVQGDRAATPARRAGSP